MPDYTRDLFVLRKGLLKQGAFVTSRYSTGMIGCTVVTRRETLEILSDTLEKPGL